MSLDGRISRERGQGGAITGPESWQRVHELRNELDAILIGIGTALIDNPNLTCRLEDGRDPLRVVLDSQLRLPPDAQMLGQESAAQTWIFCRKDAPVERRSVLEQAGAVIHPIDTNQDGRLDLRQVLRCLGQRDITSVLVEGGAAVHGAFLRAGLIDQAFLFLAPHFLGERGTPLFTGSAPEVLLKEIKTETLGNDLLLHGLVQEQPIRVTSTD
jgi:diaminohydroxyphosphoribosylaminopyrimidine deaminase/5-amino-6-(5-phosphoribosylamino)uracil reductase